jgi:CHAD domain-containing protein
MYQLHDPIPTVLHEIGSELIKAATTQAERLENEADGETLHDFRVTVRHLRSFLESYEDHIKGAKKHRGRFSDLLKLTNAGRDHEVHLGWLKARQEKADAVEHDGIRYLFELLSNDDQVDLEKVKKQYAKAATKLAQDFSAKPQKTKTSFATVTAKVLQEYRKDLAKCLRKIENPEDDSALHDALIAAEKLGHTLELLESEAAKALVKDLKGLQDLTGSLHDLHLLEPKVQTFLFAETVMWSRAVRDGAKTLSHTELKQLPQLQQSYGLAAVQRMLETEKTALFHDFQQTWLGESHQEFFKDLAGLVKELAKPPKAATKKPARSAPRKAKKPMPEKTDKQGLNTGDITTSAVSNAPTVD